MPDTPDLSHVKAVYFDLDDTLCQYWRAARAGLKAAFEEHPELGHPPEVCLQAWGEAFRDFCPTLKANGWYEEYCKTGEPTRTETMRRTLDVLQRSDDELAASLSEAYMRNRDKHLVLFDEAEEVMKKVQASGRYMGLITNGPADVQRQEVVTTGVEPYFPTVLIEGELGFGKPKKEVFEKAEKAAGAKPDECLMVGNSLKHDVQGALKAGWHAVWVRRASDVPISSSTQMPEELGEDDIPPDAIISDLRELYPMLGVS